MPAEKSPEDLRYFKFICDCVRDAELLLDEDGRRDGDERIVEIGASTP